MRILSSLLACLLSTCCGAATLTASWDHDGANIDGFRLNFQCQSKSVTVPASASERALTFDAPDGEHCTAVLAAYNANGDAPSNVVCFIPGVGEVAPCNPVVVPLEAPGAVSNLNISWRAAEPKKMGSIVFNGTNAYAMRTSGLVSTAFSYFAWVKLDETASVAGNYCAFSQGQSSSINNVFQFTVEDLGGDSDLDASAWTRDGGTWSWAPSAAAIPFEEWMAFGGTWASASSRAAYVNGGDKSVNTDTRNVSGQNRFGVGARFRSTTTGFWPGRMAHIAFWSTALTDAEHAGLAAGAAPTTVQPENLIAYYPGTVIDIDGTNYLEDVSGNGNHLQLFGGWSYDSTDSPPVGSGTTVVSADANLQWHMLQALSSDTTLQWGVLDKLLADLDLQWQTLSTVNAEADIRWAISQQLFADIAARWNVEGALALVNADLSLGWSVTASIARSLALAWGQLAGIGTDIDLRWSAMQSLAANANLRWNTLRAITVDENLPWNVLREIDVGTDIQWDVLESISADVALRWQVFNAVVSELSASWDVLQAIADGAELRWELIGRTETSLTLSWQIQQRAQFPDITGVITINTATPRVALASATPETTLASATPRITVIH